jgi:hypothetical protein
MRSLLSNILCCSLINWISRFTEPPAVAFLNNKRSCNIFEYFFKLGFLADFIFLLLRVISPDSAAATGGVVEH